MSRSAVAQSDQTWLQDLSSPRVAEWIAVQNAKAQAYLGDKVLRDSMVARLRRVSIEASLAAPVLAGDHSFFFEPSGAEPQAVVYVQDIHGPIRPLLDPNSFSRDGSLAMVSSAVSPDGRYFAYGVATVGAAAQEIRVRDASSGHDLADTLRGVLQGPVAWTRDGRGFFYVAWKSRPPRGPSIARVGPAQVLYHRAGNTQADDQLIYDRPDSPEWLFTVRVSGNGDYAVIQAADGASPENRLYFIDLDNPKRPVVGAPVVKLFDADDATYDFIDSRGPLFYLRTTHGAPRGRVVAVDINAPDESRWRPVVRESFDAILSADIVANRVVVNRLHDAHSVLQYYALDGSPRGEILLPASGTVSDVRPGLDDPEFFFTFSAPLDPPTLFRFNFDQRTTIPYRRAAVAEDLSPFETTQLFFTSPDGTRVPMLIVARRGMVLDGTHPTILAGLGALGQPYTPAFSPLAAAWIAMGGIFAIANVRGGGEYGRAWHDAATGVRKQTSFDDFSAAAQFLIDQRYTRPSALAAAGAGHGGLLAATIAIQHPDLVSAALVDDGLADMVRFDQFTVGWIWRSEYGSSGDARQRAALAAYSPVQNARPARYPATLISVRWNEDWISPVHGLKLAAALQSAQQGPAPILLRVEPANSHDAASARAERMADQLIFLAKTLGMR